jgi:leader peptidase (prepilin peptidase)/N-methyltransferase
MNLWPVLSLALLALVLLCISAVDLRERRIPNMLNLLLGLAGLGQHMARAPGLHSLFFALGNALLTAAVFGGTSWLIQRFDRNAKFGMGDLKFLVAASFWVGFAGAIVVMTGASVLALLYAVALAPWHGMRWRELRPFGPMLSVSLFSLVLLVAVVRPG